MRYARSLRSWTLGAPPSFSPWRKNPRERHAKRSSTSRWWCKINRDSSSTHHSRFKDRTISTRGAIFKSYQVRASDTHQTLDQRVRKACPMCNTSLTALICTPRWAIPAGLTWTRELHPSTITILWIERTLHRFLGRRHVRFLAQCTPKSSSPTSASIVTARLFVPSVWSMESIRAIKSWLWKRLCLKFMIILIIFYIR